MFIKYESIEKDDCFRTSVACMMGVEPSTLHNWLADRGETYDVGVINAYLELYGYKLIVETWGEDLHSLLEHMLDTYGEEYLWLLSGQNYVGPHVWIYKGDKQHWDVSDSRVPEPFPFKYVNEPYQVTHVVRYVKS